MCKKINNLYKCKDIFVDLSRFLNFNKKIFFLNVYGGKVFNKC